MSSPSSHRVPTGAHALRLLEMAALDVADLPPWWPPTGSVIAGELDQAATA